MSALVVHIEASFQDSFGEKASALAAEDTIVVHNG
jgi:hypothetical protein